jgi:hypothetical protein
MTKEEQVRVRLPDGSLKVLRLVVSEAEPWVIEYQDFDGTRHRLEGLDLFGGLQQLCADFEALGCQVVCAGARPDVRPSGMSRSMSGGRKAYVLQLGHQARREDLVDIFSPAEPNQVGTVAQQKAHYRKWLESLPGRR